MRKLTPEQQARYDAIKQRKMNPIAGFPDDAMGENVQNVPAPQQEGSLLGDMASSALPSLYRNTIEPLTHPWETSKAIGNLAVGAVNKMTPGVQQGEGAVDALIENYKQTYGNIEGIEQTLRTDPFRFLSDASMFMGGGGAALRGAGTVSGVNPLVSAGKATQKAGMAIDPLMASKNVVKGAVSKMIPEGMPQSMYEGAGKFSTTIPAADRAAMVQTALDERIPLTKKGVKKIRQIQKGLSSELDALIAQSLERGESVPVYKVAKLLEPLRDELGGFKLNRVKDLQKVRATSKEFFESLEAEGKTHVSAKELQAFKTDAYKNINWNEMKGKVDPTKNRINKAMAKAAKEEIETLAPETKDINRRWGELADLSAPHERATARVGNRDIMGIRGPLSVGALGGIGGSQAAGTFGAIAGGIGGAALTLMDNPRFKATLGIKLNDMKTRKLFDTMTINNPLPWAAGQMSRIPERD